MIPVHCRASSSTEHPIQFSSIDTKTSRSRTTIPIPTSGLRSPSDGPHEKAAIAGYLDTKGLRSGSGHPHEWASLTILRSTLKGFAHDLTIHTKWLRSRSYHPHEKVPIRTLPSSPEGSDRRLFDRPGARFDMYRFDLYLAHASHVIAVLAAMCILTHGVRPWQAAGQDKTVDAVKKPVEPREHPVKERSGPDTTFDGGRPDVTRVGRRLVPSGSFVPLEGQYWLLTPGKHASEQLSATGDSLDLGTLRGKHVLLDFWTSWCRPCIEEIPDLNNLAEDLDGRDDAVFISVNQDALTSGGDLEYVYRLVEGGSIEYPVLIDDAEPSLKRAFKVRAWPTRIIISPDGEILLSPEGRLTLGEAAEYMRLH